MFTRNLYLHTINSPNHDSTTIPAIVPSSDPHSTSPINPKTRTMHTRITDRYAAIIEWFSVNMPNPKSELNFTTPFEAVVAVLLSAQCTDKRINQVTPALFLRFPTPFEMAESNVDEILSYISTVSYPNAKAEHLLAMSQKLVNDFHGEVPDDFDLLQTLPGVGRKTANVVCATIFNQPSMPVDTHVFRVAHRIGLVSPRDKTPFDVEKTLRKYFPTEILTKAHHWLVLHGRYVCTAKNPKCNDCGIRNVCKSSDVESEEETLFK